MLQIIGWMGCLYLIIKCISISGDNAFKNSEGNMNSAATLACFLSSVGAIVFAVLLYFQGNSIVDVFASSDGPSEEEIRAAEAAMADAEAAAQTATDAAAATSLY